MLLGQHDQPVHYRARLVRPVSIDLGPKVTLDRINDDELRTGRDKCGVEDRDVF